MTEVEQRIGALRRLSTAELRAEWQRVWKRPAPGLGHDLLRRAIGWKLQERAYGGLSRSTVIALKRNARRLGGRPTPGSKRIAKPGTRLIRQWHGRTYFVSVLSDGFQYDDRRFSSLSQIAKVITGTTWSGPRFFGLVGTRAAEAIGGEG